MVPHFKKSHKSSMVLAHLSASDSRIQYFLSLAELSPDTLAIRDSAKAFQSRKEAYCHVKECQRSHKQPHYTYLEELAEASTVKPSPNLHHESMSLV
jgi:hypothetical protein